jgi:hypothetical protein
MKKIYAVCAAITLIVAAASVPITTAYALNNNAGGGPGNSGPGDKNSPGKGQGGVGNEPGPGGSAGAAPDDRGK